MITYRSHLIAYEGWRLVAIAVIAGLFFQISIGFWVALPIWIATAVLVFLFRDPKRTVPPKPLAIISPIDGTVTGIDTLEEPYTKSQVIRIQVRKGKFDIMATRSPMEGKIIKQWFGAADATAPVRDVTHVVQGNVEVTVPIDARECCDIIAQRSEYKGCRFAQWIQSDEQDNIVMAVHSTHKIFKPRCYTHSGGRIGQGQRCGIIPFHAVVQVNVPLACRVDVKVGDQVRSGTDTLATLIH